jgi:hypothetical protein
MAQPAALKLASDMLAEARIRFAEIAFTTWIPDSDLMSWINLGTYDIVIRAMPPSHEVWPPYQIPAVAGQYAYPLPDGSSRIPAFLRVSELEGDRSGVFFNGKGLDHTSRRVQLEDVLFNNPTSQQDPESFWLWNNQLFVFPIPSPSPGTIKMYYYRQPLEVVNTFDPIDLDMPWREVLLKFLLWKALEKDKNAMAQVYRTEYEQALSNMYSEARVRIEKRARFVHQSDDRG